MTINVHLEPRQLALWQGSLSTRKQNHFVHVSILPPTIQANASDVMVAIDEISEVVQHLAGIP